MKVLLSIFFSVLLLASCSDNLPKERFSPFPFNPKVTETTDSLFIKYINKVACPVRLKINTNFADPNNRYATQSPIVVPPYDTLYLKFEKPGLSEKPKNYFSFKGSEIGNPAEVDTDTATHYTYPFPKGWWYKIIQGYNGSYSHNSDYSRYAIDFALAVGDTVCAARDGIVVGLIKDYKVGGKDRKYRDYANFITLYHNDGTFSQYVHLKHNGVLVALGDTVKSSQPIGLSGMTGFTSTPHLHFNTIKPTAGKTVGFPVKFMEIDGEKIIKGMKVQH